MGLKSFHSITFVAHVLGMMIAFQLRGACSEESVRPNSREQELALEKKQLVMDLLHLQEEVADLSAKLDDKGHP